MTTALTDHAIAQAFAAQLRQELSPAELAEVIARNAAEPDPNICHSHDFTDANQTMIDALKTLGVDYGPNEDARLDRRVADAWTIAKECSFDDSNIDDDEKESELDA